MNLQGQVPALCSALGALSVAEPPPLDIDHHVPLALDMANLSAGDLVALCTRCNGIKLDRHLEHWFDSAPEHERLAPLLELQKTLLRISLRRGGLGERQDWLSNRWAVHPHEAWAVFNDLNHRHIHGGHAEPEPSAALDVAVTNTPEPARCWGTTRWPSYKSCLPRPNHLTISSEASWEALVELAQGLEIASFIVASRNGCSGTM